MQKVQSLSVDFKAELVGASLLGEADDISRIIIERLGINPRPHTRDVIRTYEDTGLFSLNSHLVIQSFRQSIYDAMPENIFHPPSLGGIGKSTDEIVEEIRLQRRREADARKFFAPFEQEASYIEIQALFQELVYEQKGRFSNLFQLFEQAWPILKQLPAATALAFIYVIPVLHGMSGDRVWTERCFGYILGFPVTIREIYETVAVAPEMVSFTAGSSLLGINSNFGGQQDDGYVSWQLTIGPVPHDHIAGVLPHTNFYQLLLLLSDYFIPAGMFVRYNISSEKEQFTKLGESENSARLGYSFFL